MSTPPRPSSGNFSFSTSLVPGGTLYRRIPDPSSRLVLFGL
jgi:hypothetical protein